MVKSVGVGSYLAFKLADSINERQHSPFAGQWFRMVFAARFAGRWCGTALPAGQQITD